MKNPKTWSKPRIVNLSRLPETLGHCMAGTTGCPRASGYGSEGHICHYGDYTGPDPSHCCQSGGLAHAGCSNGTDAGHFQAGGGCQGGGTVHQ